MRILIALPVLNEEKVLRGTVEAVASFARAALAEHEVMIVIADNGSTDATEALGRELERELPGVRYLRLARRGKGLAIREAWNSGQADAYVFMDADLATDLGALPELVGRIGSGADLAVGSRFHADSTVDRSAFRRIMSRGYRTLLGAALGTCVGDVPCGFKAASPRLVRDVMPAVRDDQWFFDTELVIRAERAGHRIEEVPVVWREARPAGSASKVRAFSLARDYAMKVLRLRRTLGTATPPSAAYGSVSELARSVDRRERWLVACVAAAVALVTSLPILVGLAVARSRGVEFTGRQILSPGDLSVYLSFIAQAKDGKWLFENLATPERLTPVLNILWLAIGWLARAASLSPLAAFHVARIALIFPFAAVAYGAIAYFLRRKPQRRVAFLLFMLGSGLGMYAAPLLRAASVDGGNYEWPIDFWVSEANGFLSMMFSPHFIASWTLLIAAVILLLIAYDTGRVRYGAYAGLAALALFQFHPFHVPTLYAVGGATLIGRTISRGFRPRQWSAYLAFLALSMPSVAYHYWLLHWTPNAYLLGNNLCLTPSLPYVLIGFGAIGALAVVGWTANDDAGSFGRDHRQFLAIWAVTQLALVYGPFPFQRRMLEGLEFPLVILAVPAMVVLRRAFARKPWFDEAFVKTYGLLLAIALFLPSSVGAVMRDIEAYAAPVPNMYYFSADESAALAWVRGHVPEDALILSSIASGNDISGWAVRRVYAGHWAATVAIDAKNVDIVNFFGEMSSSERADLARSRGISYVYEGTIERSYGGTLDGDPAFAPVFSSGGIVIYALR